MSLSLSLFSQTRVSLEVANVDSAFVATAAASAAIAAALSPPPSRRHAAHPALPWSTASSSSSSSSSSHLSLSPLAAAADHRGHFTAEAASAFTPLSSHRPDAQGQSQTQTTEESDIRQSVVRPPHLGGGGVPQSALRHSQITAAGMATPLIGQRLRLDGAGGGGIDRVPFASANPNRKSSSLAAHPDSARGDGDVNTHTSDDAVHTTDHDDEIFSLDDDELARRIDAGEDAYIRCATASERKAQYQTIANQHELVFSQENNVRVVVVACSPKKHFLTFAFLNKPIVV